MPLRVLPPSNFRDIFRGRKLREFGGRRLAIFAHCYPVYLGTKEVKELPPGWGVIFALSPASVALVVAIFLVVVATSKRVSAGSIVGALSVPFVAGIFTKVRCSSIRLFFCRSLSLLNHRENIKRLLRGEEPRIFLNF